MNNQIISSVYKHVLLATPTIGSRQSASAAIGEPVRRARRPRSVAHVPLMVPGSAGVVSGVL